MKPSDEKAYEQIEQYLLGKLPPDEANQLEKKIDEDGSFSKEVNWIKTMLSLQKHKKEFDVLDNFRKVYDGSEHEQIPLKIRWFNKRRLLLVASLATLIGYFSYLLIFDEKGEKPHSTRELVNQPILPDKAYALIELRGDKNVLGTEEDVALEEALQFIDKGEHIAALPYFEKYFKGLPDDEKAPEMRLEAGKIYLKKLFDWDNAEVHFQTVKNNGGFGIHKMEADFYQAFIAYEKGESNRAKNILNGLISQDEYPYWTNKANKLLDILTE